MSPCKVWFEGQSTQPVLTSCTNMNQVRHYSYILTGSEMPFYNMVEAQHACPVTGRHKTPRWPVLVPPL